MLFDLVLVHRDDVNQPVVQQRVHVAEVELPYHPRLVVRLLKRVERVLDALGLFIGRSPAIGLPHKTFSTEVTR